MMMPITTSYSTVGAARHSHVFFRHTIALSQAISNREKKRHRFRFFTKIRGVRNWGQNECRISYTCPRITHKAHVFWGQNHENLVHSGKELRPPRKNLSLGLLFWPPRRSLYQIPKRQTKSYDRFSISSPPLVDRQELDDDHRVGFFNPFPD